MNDDPYIVVTAETLPELIETVNEMVKPKGVYEPVGGFTVIPMSNYKNRYGQTLYIPQ